MGHTIRERRLQLDPHLHTWAGWLCLAAMTGTLSRGLSEGRGSLRR